MKTANTIKKLMTESTGTHFLDSGQDSGRHWQQNRKNKDWQAEPLYSFDDCGVTMNIYPFLCEQLKQTPESQALQKRFIRFKNKPDNKEQADWTLMQDFAEQLYEREEITNDNYLISKDGYNTTNTYNHEEILNQTLQFVLFYDGNDYFIILQLHNGADVRGGYTSPKIFKLADMDDFISKLNCHYTVTTKKGNYYTDDNYNFYSNDSEDKKDYEDVYAEGIKSIC